MEQGPVVQLVRTPACHAGGREFESRPDRFKTHSLKCVWVFLFDMVLKKRTLAFVLWGSREFPESLRDPNH